MKKYLNNNYLPNSNSNSNFNKSGSKNNQDQIN